MCDRENGSIAIYTVDRPWRNPCASAFTTFSVSMFFLFSHGITRANANISFFLLSAAHVSRVAVLHCLSYYTGTYKGRSHCYYYAIGHAALSLISGSLWPIQNIIASPAPRFVYTLHYRRSSHVRRARAFVKDDPAAIGCIRRTCVYTTLNERTNARILLFLVFKRCWSNIGRDSRRLGVSVDNLRLPVLLDTGRYYA